MPRYDGHAPGHVRDMFLNAIEAFYRWRGKGPAPTVEFEVHCLPRQISLSEACGLLWNCRDILPGSHFDMLEEFGLKSRTYAAAARAIHSRLAIS